MSSLYRTSAEKVPFYSPDGQGRDSYIAGNNGGIYKFHSNTLYERKVSPLRSFSPLSPRKEAKPVKYVPSGTGRDSYIYSNSNNYGGNFANTFFKTLRDHSPTSFSRTQIHWLRSRRNKDSLNQVNLNKRLSEPKHKRSKVVKDL